MNSTEFLAELRQQTESDVAKLKESTEQLERLKQTIKFLEKRISQSNEMLNMGGEKPMKEE